MSETDLQQLHAVVHGRVQGVGFRDATIRRAQALGLTGWVRNLPDRTVETVAVGDRPTLEQFISFLHEGPWAARVQRVNAEWHAAADTFTDFSMR